LKKQNDGKYGKGAENFRKEEEKERGMVWKQNRAKMGGRKCPKAKRDKVYNQTRKLFKT